MGALKIRQQLHALIDKADDDFINALYVIIESRLEDGDTIIGYEPSGKAITNKQLASDVEQSMEQYKNGNFHTQEEVQKRIQNW